MPTASVEHGTQIPKCRFFNTLLEDTNLAYCPLRADPNRWSEELAERSAWDTALTGGLESEWGCPTL